MNFFKRLFGGVGSGGDDGLYLYIRPDRCDEIVRLRINVMNDLSYTDDQKGLFAHKVVRGTKCFTPVEVDLHFNLQRKLVDTQITGGTIVTEADWQAWQASQSA